MMRENGAMELMQLERSRAGDPVFGPPSDRQTHLYLLAEVARLVFKTSLLHRLRRADDTEGIVSAIQKSLREG